MGAGDRGGRQPQTRGAGDALSGPDDTLTWIVQDSKASEYLLNPDHRKGASKAKYLLAFGFDRDDPETLASALVKHALGNLPGQLVEPPKGAARRVFEGHVEAPDGRLMSLRTVWEISGTAEMRFITAVPLTR